MDDSYWGEGDDDQWVENSAEVESDSSSSTFRILDENHGMGFLTKMQILRESDSLCDFTLATIDGLAEEKVHKVVLAASSDFFERLFKHENAASCLDVACRGPVLKHIVDFIYSGVISGPNEDLLEIYRTAHFMLLDRLCEKWIWFLESKWLNKDRLNETFLFAHTYKLDAIKTVCINYVFSHFSEEFFLSCPLELVADVLEHEELQISDDNKIIPLGCDFEVAVWELACRWLEKHPENREAALSKLTSVICLRCLPEKAKEKVMSVCREEFQWNDFKPDLFLLPEGESKEQILKAKRKFCCPKNTMLMRQYAGHYHYPEGSSEAKHWPDLNWLIRKVSVWIEGRYTTAIRFTYVNVWADDQDDLSESATVTAQFGASYVTPNDSNCTTWTLTSSERIVEVTGIVDDDDEEIAIFAFKTSTGRCLQAHEDRPEDDYGNKFEIRSDAEARGRHQHYLQGFISSVTEWPTLVRTLWASYNESAFNFTGLIFSGNRMFCAEDFDLDDDDGEIFIDNFSEDGYGLPF